MNVEGHSKAGVCTKKGREGRHDEEVLDIAINIIDYIGGQESVALPWSGDWFCQ